MVSMTKPDSQLSHFVKYKYSSTNTLKATFFWLKQPSALQDYIHITEV